MDNLTSLIITFDGHGKFDSSRKGSSRDISSRRMTENLSSIINKPETTEKSQIAGLKSDRGLSAKML